MTEFPTDLPGDFLAARSALHQLAFYVMAPARYAVEGRMGLTAIEGGFGTPLFGNGQRVRVKGVELIVEQGSAVTGSPLTTIAQAAKSAGIEYRVNWFDGFRDPPPAMDPTVELAVSPDTSLALGGWLAFSWELLERLRREADDSAAPSTVQLWPEHFDAAVEIGDVDRGKRAAFGASHGDAFSRYPYLYVSPWVKAGLDNRYWNAPFGSLLDHPTLSSAQDPLETSWAFFQRGLEVLAGGRR
jgi:hypothetical protein